MRLTQEQEKEMRRVFVNGWEESDVPAKWRREYFEAEMAQIESDERATEDLEAEERESDL